MLGGLAGKGEGKDFFQSLSVGGLSFFEQAFGQRLGRFHEHGIVQQYEGLLGNVGPRTLGGAFFATGCVKGDHGGVGEASAYEGVEASAVEIVSLSGLPLAGGKVEVLPIAGGLVGLDAFAPYLLYEQSADRRAVPDEFGIHAKRD